MPVDGSAVDTRVRVHIYLGVAAFHPGAIHALRMDTASPTTLAIDSVGARCHWLYEHAAHPCRRMISR